MYGFTTNKQQKRDLGKSFAFKADNVKKLMYRNRIRQRPRLSISARLYYIHLYT